MAAPAGISCRENVGPCPRCLTVESEEPHCVHGRASRRGRLSGSRGQVGRGREGLTLAGPPEGRGPVATTEGARAKKISRAVGYCRSGSSLGQDRHKETDDAGYGVRKSR